ncbi:MAG: hypothetical protein IPK19_23230 [Chloroflexi bacterium]|nr:hypothetical protein [Chloroflexota bacterium]
MRTPRACTDRCATSSPTKISCTARPRTSRPWRWCTTPTCFEAAGVEVPTTWEELRAAAAALTTDEVAGLTTGIELPRFLAFLYQAGGAILGEDGSVVLNSPETVQAVNEVRQPVHRGRRQEPGGSGRWLGR